MADAGQSLVDAVLDGYQEARKKEIDLSLVWKFAGVELMRRLLGVAQLPLERSLSQKEELLHCSEEWILNK